MSDDDEAGELPARRLILGTAGHIDHGKTALVHALTGVDTDRLPDEKRRGITIDLGFAELALDDGTEVGIVDVPGHEGFIRNMVAGATGIDLALLVVAADEGVMPQTREHLAIVELLDVDALVVALTKVDRVEEEWLPLVRDEVRELLEEGRHGEAPIVATSATEGTGIGELRKALAAAAGEMHPREVDDRVRLPVDRVFTVRGTGTVVTGTLWSGRLRGDDDVRFLPPGIPGRIRGIEVHGAEREVAVAGERTAVAVSGADISREALDRGDTLVRGGGWCATTMLTVHLRVLEAPGWPVEHGQRVRVHVGTAEVMARAVLPGRNALAPGGAGWAQLRLEAPVVARARDRVVIRSYSPVMTIAGARIAEPLPPKRTRLDPEERRRLDTLLTGTPREALVAALELTGWDGVAPDELPIRTGFAPAALRDPRRAAEEAAAVVEAGGRLFGSSVLEEGSRRLRETLRAAHDFEPLRPGVPLGELRQGLPGPRGEALAEALVRRLEDEGEIIIREELAALAGFHPELDDDASAVREGIIAVLSRAGLEAPEVGDFSGDLRQREEFEPLLDLLRHEGTIVRLGEERYALRERVEEAARKVREELGGREELGPADFRSVLPLTRRFLIPVLEHLDRTGVTVRRSGGRTVVGNG